MARNSTGAHVWQPGNDSWPLIDLGSAAGLTAAVNIAGPHWAAETSSPAGIDVLRLLLSSVPVAVALFLPNVTIRFRPDCPITKGELRKVDAAAHAGPAAALPLTSILHVPSTEIGAVRWRPLRRIPARPSNGNPTRTMYATTKFRFVRDMNLNPGRRFKKEVRRGAGLP